MLDKVLAPHLKKEEKESKRSLRIIKWEMQAKAVDKVLKLQTNKHRQRRRKDEVEKVTLGFIAITTRKSLPLLTSSYL